MKYCENEIVQKRAMKFVLFSNGVINSWRSLPAQCLSCSTVDTSEKYVSVALESETDVNC